MNVRVAQVGPDQWKRWRAIRLDALRTDPDAFGSTLERELGFDRTLWRSRLDGVGGPSVLAVSGDVPVAMGAGFGYRPGALMVVAMWTRPAWRGRGLGRRILDRVVGWARERDLAVELWVEDDNPGARALYTRYGFVPNGHREPLRAGSARTMSAMTLPGRHRTGAEPGISDR
ncbi:MAG TPA: GNAT family N-acetyltransferase [Nocardioidaceae bacterium]|nr:GNAT family N-acetyltransferase [Nocardioidaceae bacterium]